MRIALLLLIASTMLADGAELPDPALTPGVARTDLTVEQICKTKWGKDHRAVTAAMKRQVFLAYGYAKQNKDPRCPCEIDHLISRELGGADDVKNLWVQSYQGQWNAHDKDRLENRLHKEMCAGNLTLEETSTMLRDDWRKAFVTYFGEPK
jgi:hypothetical protein